MMWSRLMQQATYFQNRTTNLWAVKLERLEKNKNLKYIIKGVCLQKWSNDDPFFCVEMIFVY